MKILHLFNTYLPKTQTWAFNLLRFTPEVEVFIGAYRFLPNSWWDDRFTAVSGSLPKRIVGFKEKVAYRILNEEQRAKRRRRKQRQLIDKIWAPAITANEIDLVHVHFANVGWEFLELKRQTGIPYVVSFYGMDYEYIPYHKPAFINRYKELLKEADAIFCEGPHGKKILIDRYGAGPDKVKVVPLGVEVDKIPFYERLKQSGQLRLVQIASFVEKKGHEYSIRALANAQTTCPNIELTLVGKGPLLEDLKKLVTDLGIEEKVAFVPFIDYATLSVFLLDFDVFIHPSCYSAERDCEGGAPVVLLDAQATGLPVIATYHCDIPAEVVDGKTGLLVQEKDVPALTEAIAEFYAMDSVTYQGYARRARTHVKECFSVSENANRNLKLYQQIIR